jgi:hypothetical protein
MQMLFEQHPRPASTQQQQLLLPSPASNTTIAATTTALSITATPGGGALQWRVPPCSAPCLTVYGWRRAGGPWWQPGHLDAQCEGHPPACCWGGQVGDHKGGLVVRVVCLLI